MYACLYSVYLFTLARVNVIDNVIMNGELHYVTSHTNIYARVIALCAKDTEVRPKLWSPRLAASSWHDGLVNGIGKTETTWKHGRVDCTCISKKYTSIAQIYWFCHSLWKLFFDQQMPVLWIRHRHLLIEKWDTICKKIKDNTRTYRYVYGCYGEVRLPIMEFSVQFLGQMFSTFSPGRFKS